MVRDERGFWGGIDCRQHSAILLPFEVVEEICCDFLPHLRLQHPGIGASQVGNDEFVDHVAEVDIPFEA